MSYYITLVRSCKQISSIVDSNHKLLRSEHSPSASWGNGGLWCIWRDSNSHAFRHSHLKAACMPFPPQMQKIAAILRSVKLGSPLAQLTGLEPAVSWFVAMCSHPIELQLHSFAELCDQPKKSQHQSDAKEVKAHNRQDAHDSIYKMVRQPCAAHGSSGSQPDALLLSY